MSEQKSAVQRRHDLLVLFMERFGKLLENVTTRSCLRIPDTEYLQGRFAATAEIAEEMRDLLVSVQSKLGTMPDPEVYDGPDGNEEQQAGFLPAISLPDLAGESPFEALQGNGWEAVKTVLTTRYEDHPMNRSRAGEPSR
jgi:hypothetical protein